MIRVVTMRAVDGLAAGVGAKTGWSREVETASVKYSRKKE
jgi:hypothetical protein